MIITIEEARKLMGEANKKYTDEQIEAVVDILTVMADLAIFTYLEKRKERKEAKNEQEQHDSNESKNI